ncbi:hypothetical protein SAMN04487785_109176 [Dyella jiangningensis]|uniref:hypothetical protein n=1 Tax=Dyella sp. AtDHG13 TaxID=1938897 RepID=UPI000887EF1F|nr:hypothetical protein [Dyella sp. AtDHG13]PXV57052.1 hypothetical protein BDW41_108174 [Dyella sp. AtDHG13]SDK65396.1 hypothetical protein SAMN04487785_109176 [Dyella jiangningensis]
MKISPTLRWLLLAAIALCVFVFVRGRQEPNETSAAVPAEQPTETAAPAQVPAPQAPMPTAAAPSSSAPLVDLFPAQSWLPPPPPPSTTPPPPPEPPPLPFVVKSVWVSAEGSLFVLLSANGQDIPLCNACQRSGFLRSGNVVLGHYRIESVTSSAVSLVYLPLNRKQRIQIAGG